MRADQVPLTFDRSLVRAGWVQECTYAFIPITRAHSPPVHPCGVLVEASQGGRLSFLTAVMRLCFLITHMTTLFQSSHVCVQRATARTIAPIRLKSLLDMAIMGVAHRALRPRNGQASRVFVCNTQTIASCIAPQPVSVPPRFLPDAITAVLVV